MLHVQATYASYHSVYMHVHCSAQKDVLQSTDKALKAQCDARVVYVKDEKPRVDWHPTSSYYNTLAGKDTREHVYL